MTIQAVVFEIGNVLVKWQPGRAYDSAIDLGRRKAMFAQVDLHGMNAKVDLGHHSTDTVYAMADDQPDNISPAHARGWSKHFLECPNGWATRAVAAKLLDTAEAA